MELALIANDASGSGADPGAIADALRGHGAQVTRIPLADLDDARAAARDTTTAAGPPPLRVQRVVAAGGDGTLGPAAELATSLGVPLAVIPTGTANDLARALSLPLDDLDAAVRLAATGERRRPVDLAYAGPTPFLNAAAAGLSVQATRRAEPLKRALGPSAYGVGALVAGARARPVQVRVTADGRDVFSGRAWQVIVAGTGAFGGGSQLDDAEPGALDVTVLVAGPRLALVRRAYGMRAGGLTDQPGVLHARGRSVTVAGPRAFNVDGDVRAVPDGHFTLGPRVAIIVP